MKDVQVKKICVSLRQLAVTEGTQMLQESARALVLEGITTVDELNRVAYTID